MEYPTCLSSDRLTNMKITPGLKESLVLQVMKLDKNK